MKSNRAIGLIVALTVGLVMPATSWADHHEGPKADKPGKGRMEQRRHHPIHEPMRKQMRAHDDRLEELVAAMNSAEGQAKVDAIAAVVNEMMAQRRTMRAHHDAMRDEREGKKMKDSKTEP